MLGHTRVRIPNAIAATPRTATGRHWSENNSSMLAPSLEWSPEACPSDAECTTAIASRRCSRAIGGRHARDGKEDPEARRTGAQQFEPSARGLDERTGEG